VFCVSVNEFSGVDAKSYQGEYDDKNTHCSDAKQQKNENVLSDMASWFGFGWMLVATT
jgi:hypothetical protein